jgi:prophage regulatory protein
MHVCRRLSVSSAKLFDMVAKGQFPKPFVIVPKGRAVGWLEADVDAWIKTRSQQPQGDGI